MFASFGEEKKSPACEEIDSRLVLFAAGELEAPAADEISEHLKQCSSCSAALVREQELIEMLCGRSVEPDAALLASCRASLVDALDQAEVGWVRRALRTVMPAGILAPRPALSAAMLLVVGFSVGLFGPKLLQRSGAGTTGTHAVVTATNTADGATNDPAATPQDAHSIVTKPLEKIDLRSAEVAGITVSPSGPMDPPQVQLQLKTQQPVTLRGDVNDAEVKHMLINALRNNQRFDPDMRLDAVELLRMRNDDPEVRAALCQAVHTDQNAAVRLKALDALSTSAGPQDQIRQTMLDALVNDQNPGVRVEAMNTLRDMAARGEIDSDSHVLAVLRDRMKKDPNTYIRIQSAAALRDLEPAQKF